MDLPMDDDDIVDVTPMEVTLLLSLGPSMNPSMSIEDIEKLKAHVLQLKNIYPEMQELSELAFECEVAIFYIYEWLPSCSKNWTQSEIYKHKIVMKKMYYRQLRKTTLRLPYLNQ